MLPDDQPTPSKATATKYQLLKELGRGGMGVVHLAMSRGPQGFTKLVVLKMMRRQLANDFESRRMFLEEARITARLTHPNLVDVYEVTDYGEMPTIVMEYLEGQTLAALMYGSATPTKPSRRLLLYVLTKVLAGLGAAHDLRDFDGTPLHLIHRDASPHNIFVLYDGQVKVLDFGIAKAERSEVETQAGTLKGKIRYMPPEQLLHLSQDRRVDIFAVGVALWEALAGQRLWGARTDDEVVRELSARRLPAMPADVDVPPDLAAICARALAPEPSDRYPTAQEFQQDLEQYLATWSDRIGAVQLSAYMREIFSQERESAKWLIESHIRETKKLEDTAAGSTRAGPPQSHSQSQPQSPTQPVSPRRRSKWVGFIALPSVVVVASLLLLAGVFAGGRRRAWETERASTAAAGALAGRAAAGQICESGSKSCDGACVSVDSPEHGCGGEGCSACNVSNATARCNQLGRCDVAVCHKGFEDCDEDGKNGCEINVRTDPDHCGSCARRCPPLFHAERGCGDVCTIWRCLGGFRDCNGRVDDGCEVDALNDQRNCGHCGHACPRAQKCHRGECL
jgi:serine/threonine protein kinase